MFSSPVFDLFWGYLNPPHVAGNADRAGSKQPVDSQSRTDPAVVTSQQLSNRLYIAQKNLYTFTIQGVRFPCLGVNTLN